LAHLLHPLRHQRHVSIGRQQRALRAARTLTVTLSSESGVSMLNAIRITWACEYESGRRRSYSSWPLRRRRAWLSKLASSRHGSCLLPLTQCPKAPAARACRLAGFRPRSSQR
jgi:hypothetical protein